MNSDIRIKKETSNRTLMNKHLRRNCSDHTTPLELSKREHLLIINEVFSKARISDNLLSKMRFGIVSENGLTFHITADELAELASYVLFAINRAGDKPFRVEMEKICKRIEELLDIQTDEIIEDDLSETPYSEEVSDWQVFIQDALHDKEFKEFKNIEEYISKTATEYNRRPIEEMGGLSPEQVSRLIYGSWEDKQGAITFNRDVPLSEIEEARMFQNARTFLRAVLESGGVKATAKGNLNRKSVSDMTNAMSWPSGYLDSLRIVSKVLNETDVTQLHALRITLELAGLLRLTKGTFKITSSGKKLLEDSRAGELYALLFITYFRDFNLSYADRMPENSVLQDTIAFSFYMLAENAARWEQGQKIAPMLLLPSVRTHIMKSAKHSWQEDFTWLVLARILSPLESFGLLRLRESRKGKILESFKVRKTDLFDRLLRFDLADR